jgi:hypothetical protein
MPLLLVNSFEFFFCPQDSQSYAFLVKSEFERCLILEKVLNLLALLVQKYKH